MTIAEPTIRRWTLAEYYQLAEQGWFADQRVQLIRGEIIQMPPQGHAHARSISLVQRALESIFANRRWIRVQMPLNVGRDSDPEPDIAVAERAIETYSDHPTTAVLVAEVSDTTLRLDRRKAGLYASAGIGEYWIVNLIDHQLEVHRLPLADAATEFGYRYADTRSVALDQTISPLASPESMIEVKTLFP